MTSLYDFSLTDIDGAALPLERFRGKAVLLVNVASKCGLTPQYKGLEALYRDYRARGLVVLGLPCNQFGGQEPGTEAEIRTFCESRYDVTFPLSSKVDVNGAGRHALYAWLAGPDARFPGDIQWNFEKFVVDRTGAVAARLGPRTTPDDAKLVAAVEAALA
jgi:glutathione peroxidase